MQLVGRRIVSASVPQAYEYHRESNLEVWELWPARNSDAVRA
jgi:hypothetical protein